MTYYNCNLSNAIAGIDTKTISLFSVWKVPRYEPGHGLLATQLAQKYTVCSHELNFVEARASGMKLEVCCSVAYTRQGYQYGANILNTGGTGNLFLPLG